MERWNIMSGFVVRQPNGLLCRFSTIVDCPTHYNMTEEEYIKAREDLQTRAESEDIIKNYLRPFEWLDDYFYPNNMTEEEFEKIKKEMELPKEQCHYTET